ncbi:hypothetical protein ACVW07_002310 [Cellulomonas sp. URHB0016]
MLSQSPLDPGGHVPDKAPGVRDVAREPGIDHVLGLVVAGLGAGFLVSGGRGPAPGQGERHVGVGRVARCDGQAYSVTRSWPVAAARSMTSTTVHSDSTSSAVAGSSSRSSGTVRPAATADRSSALLAQPNIG